jgi:hypothetical protein
VAQPHHPTKTDTLALLGALVNAAVEVAVWGAVLFALISISL